MLIGIDSFFDRLDVTNLSDFQLWNGGQPGVDIAHPVIGGEPAFAGRNFLGGKFIWAHAEATNTLKVPSPWDLPRLTVNTNRIAPIQKPNGARQSQVGQRGFLFGQIDGKTICNRIASGAKAGEFVIGANDTISVWLGVDPNEPFTVEYWSGWADAVNSFIYNAPAQRPFAACILCRYNRVGAQFVRDPHVTATLAQPAFRRGLLITCHDFWADAPDPDDEGVRPGPNLDFSVFRAAEMPSIWRFSNSFRDAAGVAQAVTYSLDIVREVALPEVLVPATSFMLKPAKWQPSALNLLTMGFSNSDALNDATITCVNNTPIPAMWDNADDVAQAAAARDGHVQVPEVNAKVVGRYLRHPTDRPAAVSVGPDEIQRLSDAGLSTFVVWERATGNVPNKTAYFNVVGRGTEDATLAFNYCGDVLRVPPHTIIYFTVDYDAGDPNPSPVVIAAGGAGGPQAEALVSRYFAEVATQRDAYTQAHPDRPYEIGVYAPGKVLEWCYTRGLVSGFWQSVSSGAAGNGYGTRPWGHASRWQYQFTEGGNPPKHPLPAPWPCAIAGSIDPDVDWGDGGQWNQNDRPALTLTELEDQEAAAILRAFLHQLLPGLVP